MTTASLILVHTTCADRERAAILAERLVAEHLAACASIGAPIQSIYPWAGEVRREREVPLTLKTTTARFPALAARLRALHHYEVPELLATAVVEADAAYADWVLDWVGCGASNQE